MSLFEMGTENISIDVLKKQLQDFENNYHGHKISKPRELLEKNFNKTQKEIEDLLEYFRNYREGCKYLFCDSDGNICPVENEMSIPDADFVYIGGDREMTKEEIHKAAEMIYKAMEKGKI